VGHGQQSAAVEFLVVHKPFLLAGAGAAIGTW
jgi:hypothetical protein